MWGEVMDFFANIANALNHVLANDNDFTDEEIKEACLYALHKYGNEYPALGEAMVEIIHQQRFSDWTFENYKRKRTEVSVAYV